MKDIKNKKIKQGYCIKRLDTITSHYFKGVVQEVRKDGIIVQGEGYLEGNHHGFWLGMMLDNKETTVIKAGAFATLDTGVKL